MKELMDALERMRQVWEREDTSRCSHGNVTWNCEQCESETVRDVLERYREVKAAMRVLNILEGV